MSPVICAGALSAIKYLKSSNGIKLRAKHQERAKKLKSVLKDKGISILENDTHIVPVMIKDAVKCKAISDELISKHDIYVQPINYPTVDMGTERLRFAPTPLHTDAMMLDLADKLGQTLGFRKSDIL